MPVAMQPIIMDAAHAKIKIRVIPFRILKLWNQSCKSDLGGVCRGVGVGSSWAAHTGTSALAFVSVMCISPFS